MKQSNLVVRLVMLVLSLSIVPVGAHAQFRASLRGTVADPTGAVVPGAKVTLVNRDTNATQVVTTDDNGIYVFNALPPAPYKLTVERDGFQQKVLEDVRIIPEQLNSLNVEIAVGQQQQTVTVSGTTQALDTETATVSSTISSNQIQHMPSFNRDVFQLAQLTPGVSGDASQQSGGGSYSLPGTQGPGGTGGSAGIFQTENGPQIQSAGGQYETNSISVDGISTVSAVWGGTSVITPSEDSVQDMKVVSNNYDAEYGRFSGAQIQVTSKSGTNQLHGSAFFKASRPGLNAYQRWNGPGSDVSVDPVTGAKLTPAERGLNRDNNRFNQYGGSLGGPLWKNKIFAFFNWETSPLQSSGTSQGWYETPQFDQLIGATSTIAGRYLTVPGAGVNTNGQIARTCASIGLVQGVNCNQVPGGLDVGSPITTGIGMQDLTYGGSPNNPGVGGGLDGVPDIGFYNAVNPVKTSQMQFNGRVDANITANDRLAFTIYWVPVTQTSYNGPVRAQNLWHHEAVNDAFAIIWDHTFSPTLLNQARANAAGWRWNEVNTNPQAPFGLPQATVGNINDGGCGGSACSYGSANLNYFGAPGPSILNQWTYTYSDVLTKVLGRHNVKVGGDLTRLYYLNENIYGARPSFNFHNIWDFANDAPFAEQGQFASATGLPSPNRQDDRQNLWGFFAQDDFKLRPNLTINLGLRWSYFGSLYTKENNLDVLQLGAGPAAVTGMGIRVGGNLATPQKNNFGPMIGFAYSPGIGDGKLVFRGGFGIAYNQNEIAITASSFGNPPNVVSPQFVCAYPYTTNPTCSGTGILYETAGQINSIFGYAPNPAAITTFGPNNLPTTGVNSVTGFPTDQKSIATYHYSFDMQYQLPFDSVMSLGYIGNQTRHLLRQFNYNVVAANAGYPLNPLFSRVGFWDNAANANYNGMITSLNHNFSHTFQLAAQYTWSKAMDENSGPYFEDPYPFNVHEAYGRADYNVTNAFKVWGMWQPIFFRGSHSWAEKVIGGWSVSGIWNLHSGFPWNPVYNTNGIYYQGSDYGQIRPVSIASGYGNGTANHDFMGPTNPNFNGNGAAYFGAVPYALGPSFPGFTYGPGGGIQRNTLNGPGYNDVDASLSKAFGLPNNKVLGEGARLEVRADIYNVFNKLNLNTQRIDNSLGSVAPNGTVTPNPDFGIIGEALGSRTIQLQARFSF